MIAHVLFWVLLFGALYSYLLYPVLLLLLPARSSKRDNAATPGVARFTLIVTAYNESARIETKLRNSLALDYPRDAFDIVVASDCSDDDTDAIVERYADDGIDLVRAPERLGKEGTQALAIAQALGDVLVFSDTGTELPANALEELAELFRDPAIGAVSSEDRFVTHDGKTVGEGLYVRYEMWLRKLESARSGLVGLSGSFFAVRREQCTDWDTLSPSDFNSALACARSGRRAVSSPSVFGIYPDIQDSSREYARKVRTVLRGMTGLSRNLDMLNVFRYPGFALQLWSHKVMRWLVPWFLLGLAIVSVAVAPTGTIYAAALAGQALFYLAATIAHWLPSTRRLTVVRVIYYFVQVNIAIAEATVRFVSGRRMVTWTPSVR